jgi:hypothetical protein
MTTSLHDSLADIFGGGSSPTSPTAAKPIPDATAARIASVKEVLKRTGVSAAASTEPAAQARTTDPEQIKYHTNVIQGSDEWAELRRGILTASEMKLIITPTLKVAENDKCSAHVYEIAAQRITGYVEPHYISDDMLRGHEDEIEARLQYILNYAPVQEVGFITSDRWGFTIGYSPDGLVGNDGLIECKSRRQKYQLQTIVENVSEETIPADYTVQIQTGLLVTGRKWCDFITYCGGMDMAVIRVFPIPGVQEAIIKAATAFEAKVQAVVDKYHAVKKSSARLLPTERRVEQEITI